MGSPAGGRHPHGPLRLLYADVDGTLVGPGGSLFSTGNGPSARGAAAVAALHEVHVQLVLVSGRTRDQMREVARLLGAAAFIAELGAFVVEREDTEQVTTNFGAFRGTGMPFVAMARSGAGGFLLERYGGVLELHAPWAFRKREATMLFRGLVDEEEVTEALAQAGYRWLELRDNGPIARSSRSLNLPELRAYHLVPRGVSKAAAVRIHRERCGISIDQAAAVGNSPADLEMAAEVGTMAMVGTERAVPSGTAGNVFTIEQPAGDGFAEAVEVFLGRAR